MSPRPSTRGCADGMTCGEWRAYTRAWAGFNPLRARCMEFCGRNRMQKRWPAPLTARSSVTGSSSRHAAKPAARACRPGPGPGGWDTLRESRPMRDRFPSAARRQFDDLPAVQDWRQANA